MPSRDPQHQSAPLKQSQPYLSEVPKAEPELTAAAQSMADKPAFKPGTPLAIGDVVTDTNGDTQVVTGVMTAKSNSQIEAERNITRRIMEAGLQEVRALPRPWDQLTEEQQDEVIHRLRLAANTVTAEVIATVAAGASKSRAIVDIDGVNVKAKVCVVTLKLPSTHPSVHDIIGARGEQAVLVMGSDPTDYGVNRDGIVPDADQPGLPLGE